MTPDASKAKAKRHRDNWKKKALALEAENKAAEGLLETRSEDA